MLLLLNACAPVGAVTDYCLTAAPIYISVHDALTPATARQILLQNQTYEAICLSPRL